jgi:hypothetical protein
MLLEEVLYIGGQQYETAPKILDNTKEISSI